MNPIDYSLRWGTRLTWFHSVLSLPSHLIQAPLCPFLHIVQPLAIILIFSFQLDPARWCLPVFLSLSPHVQTIWASSSQSPAACRTSQCTVTLRYNAVVGRHLLGPPYKRGTLWDPVDLFDIIIPWQSKGQAKLNVCKHKPFISEHTIPMLSWLNICIDNHVETNKWTKTR